MNPQFFDQYRVHIVNKIADKLEYAPALKPGIISRLFRKEDPNAERAIVFPANWYRSISAQLASITSFHPGAPLSPSQIQALFDDIVTDAIALFRSRNPQPQPK